MGNNSAIGFESAELRLGVLDHSPNTLQPAVRLVVGSLWSDWYSKALSHTRHSRLVAPSSEHLQDVSRREIMLSELCYIATGHIADRHDITDRNIITRHTKRLSMKTLSKRAFMALPPSYLRYGPVLVDASMLFLVNHAYMTLRPPRLCSSFLLKDRSLTEPFIYGIISWEIECWFSGFLYLYVNRT